MRFIALLFLALCTVASSGFAQAPLRPNDTFELQLSGMPAEYAQDFRGQYTVGDDGTVSIPLIGPVKAAGLSSSQLQRAIEKKLVSEKIFTSPTVLLVLPMQSRFVTVGGGVRQPQTVWWSADLTLSSAIKRAGGISDFGNKSKIRVIRDGKSGVFNLNKSDQDPNQNPKLLPGDEVEVPE
ncbi:polysaccharide biosynthesis/export family protein [Verrucomicrobiota bacterium sgz303538]